MSSFLHGPSSSKPSPPLRSPRNCSKPRKSNEARRRATFRIAGEQLQPTGRGLLQSDPEVPGGGNGEEVRRTLATGRDLSEPRQPVLARTGTVHLQEFRSADPAAAPRGPRERGWVQQSGDASPARFPGMRAARSRREHQVAKARARADEAAVGNRVYR